MRLPSGNMEAVTGSGYIAARERAAIHDRSTRVRIEVSGPQAAATLNGLVTNDVAALGPGGGLLAAALTARGKVIAALQVSAREESFLVDVEPEGAAGLLAMLRKFVNPRFATFRDVTGDTCAVGVFGPDAARCAAVAVGGSPMELGELPVFAHVRGEVAGAPVFVSRTPELGVPGFQIVGPAAASATLSAALRAGGAEWLDDGSAEVLRVEAGWPRHGLDFDENCLAQEVGFERLGAISFNKGCYIGQETVARIHFRGHVNRSLRGVRSAVRLTPGAPIHDAASAVTITPDAPPTCATRADAERPAAGDVRSCANSPAFGHIGLAYVRREIADGAEVTLQIPDGYARATVVGLPFVK